MAQESKVTEKATESKAAEMKLIVSREVFGKGSKGEDLYSYYIDAVFRGQKSRISLIAEEGGYEFLGIIFGDFLTAEARFTENKYQLDEKSEPMVILGVEVFYYDETIDVEYTAPLKPQRKSDKNVLANWRKILDSVKKQ